MSTPTTQLASVPAGGWMSGLLRVRPVVLDTGPLTCDVISTARSRSGLPSPLRVAMELGVLRGFAASHVWAEVPRVLARRAGHAGVAAEVLERIWWDHYIPLIRFVDCTGLPTTEQSSTLTRRDETDANTLVLAGLLAPVVIIAEDKDIVSSGLAYEQWRDLYEVAETVHTGHSHVQGAAMAAVLTGYGVAGVGRLAVRAARNPWLIALAGIGALLLYQSAGTWVPRLRASWRRGAAGRREYLDALGEMLALAAARVRHAEIIWQDAERGNAGGTMLHRVARILATAETPMTRSELVAELKPARHRAAMTELADLFHARSAFHEPTGGRWQLGREKIDFGGLAASTAVPPRTGDPESGSRLVIDLDDYGMQDWSRGL